MAEGDQAAEGADWRRRVNNMRTLGFLRPASLDLRSAGEAVDRLKPGALQAAAQNPDHSEAGRGAAASALKGRGLALEPWQISVLGFVTREDLADGEKLFFGFGRKLRKFSGLALFAILLGVLALAVVAPAEMEQASQLGAENVEINLLGARIGSDALFSLIGLATITTFLLWLFASAFRRKPARVLLLRKFNNRALSNVLASMISNEMRPYGHVISLSDKHIRRDRWGWLSMATLGLANPLAAAWLIIGAPIRFVFRLFDRSAMGPAVVLNARDYRNLARRLRDRVGLNLQVATTSKEAFLVRTSDAWWKLIVRLMLDSCDAIVVDLSQVTDGTAWELDVIRDEDAAARCVFIALWGKGELAEAEMRRRGFEQVCHFYAPDGHMVKRAQFRDAMLGAMRATHG